MRPTRLSTDRRAVALAAAAALFLLAAAPAAAQFAGVPLPPPRRAEPPRPVARHPVPDSATLLERQRDSIAAIQRLDIQAWVDSAAPALARQPPAAPDSLRRPPAIPGSPRRPDGRPDAAAAPGDGRRGPGAVARLVPPGSVAAAPRWEYLRPWPFPAPPFRSV